MRINTYMDFVFIVLYCLTLILLVEVNTKSSILKMTTTIAVIVTGVLDYWEDVRLLGLLKIGDFHLRINALLARPV